MELSGIDARYLGRHTRESRDLTDTTHHVFRKPIHKLTRSSASLGSVAAPTGSAVTRLIVLRGNSAAGKSTVAAELRRRFGRGIAVVAQDNLRRVVLRERDVPGGANIGLIEATARYALDHRYHVIVEGILHAARYGDMLRALRADHRGA